MMLICVWCGQDAETKAKAVAEASKKAEDDAAALKVRARVLECQKASSEQEENGLLLNLDSSRRWMLLTRLRLMRLWLRQRWWQEQRQQQKRRRERPRLQLTRR